MSPKAKSKIKKSEAQPVPARKVKYYEAVGRRKNAISRVRLFENGSEILINDKDYRTYFPMPEFQKAIESPLKIANLLGKFKITAKVKGGGRRGQAEAVRHGISRALVIYNSEFKRILKPHGFLKRDPRVKERRKYGLKKARRAPQWSKR